MGNYYELLGVRPDATVELIEKAYRDLAVKLHPDKNPADAEAAKKRFQQLRHAYETLVDADRRYKYNAAHCRLKSGWFLVPMDTPVRQMQFNRDGTFALQAQRFRAEDPVRGTVSFQGAVATATISKAPGAGEEIIISGPGVMERYRFHNLRWFCWTPPEAGQSAPGETSSAPQQNPATGRAISTIVVTSDNGPPAPDQKPQPSAAKPTRLHHRWSMIAAAPLVALGAGWALKGLQHQGPSPGTVEEREKSVAERARQFEIEQQERQQQAREQAAARAAEAERTRHKMEAARNRDRLLALVRRGSETLRVHDELVKEAKAWQEIVGPLLTNEDGRKLASQEVHVRAFVVEYRKPRLSLDAVAALRLEIDKLLVPLREAANHEEPAYSPPSDLETILNQKHGELETALAGYRSSRSLITSLIASTTQRADQTLAAAMDELVKKDELQRAAKIAQETEAANQKLTQLEADNARRKKEAELANKTELARAAEAEEARKTQKLRDRTEADSREVRTLLAYFFAKSSWQPVSGPRFNGMEQAGRAQPMSLSRLQGCGALNNNTDGFRSLLSVVTNTWDTTRPAWGVSPNLEDLSAADMEKLTKAQDYLNRLGPTLVEIGLLAE